MSNKRHLRLSGMGRAYGRLREGVTSALYRSQLGPTRESESNRFGPLAPWQNRRFRFAPVHDGPPALLPAGRLHARCHAGGHW
jgi:hypothetical protein